MQNLSFVQVSNEYLKTQTDSFRCRGTYYATYFNYNQTILVAQFNFFITTVFKQHYFLYIWIFLLIKVEEYGKVNNIFRIYLLFRQGIPLRHKTLDNTLRSFDFPKGQKERFCIVYHQNKYQVMNKILEFVQLDFRIHRRAYNVRVWKHLKMMLAYLSLSQRCQSCSNCQQGGGYKY